MFGMVNPKGLASQNCYKLFISFALLQVLPKNVVHH